jgi:hypothetical protein
MLVPQGNRDSFAGRDCRDGMKCPVKPDCPHRNLADFLLKFQIDREGLSTGRPLPPQVAPDKNVSSGFFKILFRIGAEKPLCRKEIDS